MSWNWKQISIQDLQGLSIGDQVRVDYAIETDEAKRNKKSVTIDYELHEIADITASGKVITSPADYEGDFWEWKTSRVENTTDYLRGEHGIARFFIENDE
jgi:hypothetical protein